MAENTYKNRKSYFLFEKLNDDEVARVQKMGATEGFVPVFLSDHDAVMDAYSKISHCMGLIVQGPLSESEVARVADFEKLSSVRAHILPEGADAAAAARSLISTLFPEKLKDLCQFSISKIFPMLVPEGSLSWSEVKPESNEINPDFLVSCETLADHFMGTVSLRGRFQSLRGFHEFFQKMSDDEILNFCAEVGNEVLGVINFNLLKAKIAAQVTLPMMVKESEGVPFRRRSSYYLPSYLLRDPRTGIVVTFQFLVPFLKDAKFDRDLNFEVGWVQGDNIELF